MKDMESAVSKDDTSPLLEKNESKLDKFLGKSMTTKADFAKYHDKVLPGIISGLEFPFTVEQMRSEKFGPKWLTSAFRSSGAMPDDVEVIKVVEVKDISAKVGGGAADKALLFIEYNKEYTGFDGLPLPTKLFCKIPSLDVEDRKMAAEMDAAGPEVAFAHMFQSAHSKSSYGIEFPMRTVPMYFVDINPESTNFIQIQGCLPFNETVGSKPTTNWPEEGCMFPAFDKYKDYEIPDEETKDRLYHLAVKGAAAQCAWFQTSSKEVQDAIKKVFPVNSKLGAFPASCHCLMRYLGFWGGRSLMFFGLNYVQYVCPQLVPAEILDPENIAAFMREYEEMLYYMPEILYYITQRTEECGYVVYGHPNQNLDNAFFYQENGEWQIGGLDFGAYGGQDTLLLLSGCISCADDRYLCNKEEEMVKLFAREYSNRSGVQWDENKVYQDWKLTQVLKPLIGFAIALKLDKYITHAEYKQVKTIRDKRIDDDFYVRCFTNLAIGVFTRWKWGNSYDHFQTWKQENNVGSSCCDVTGYIFYWPWLCLHAGMMRCICAAYNHAVLGACCCLCSLLVLGAIVAAIFFSVA